MDFTGNLKLCMHAKEQTSISKIEKLESPEKLGIRIHVSPGRQEEPSTNGSCRSCSRGTAREASRRSAANSARTRRPLRPELAEVRGHLASTSRLRRAGRRRLREVARDAPLVGDFRTCSNFLAGDASKDHDNRTPPL